MPLCTPASTSGELPVGVRVTPFLAPPTTRLVWRWVEDVWSSLASTGIGCVVCGVWWGWGGLGRGGYLLEKPLMAFVWLKVLLLKEPMWPVLHPCCFVFGPENIWDLRQGLTKKLLNCVPPPSHTSSSFHPSPKFWTCRAATHLHQNEELQGQNALAIFLWQQGPFFPPNLQRAFCMRGLKLMEEPPGLDTGEVSCIQMKGKRLWLRMQMVLCWSHNADPSQASPYGFPSARCTFAHLCRRQRKLS